MQNTLDFLTSEKVEFFFNNYKHNNSLIYRLEQKIIEESESFEKWQNLILDNSQLTRKLFIKNMSLVNAYILPAIENPCGLKKKTLESFLLHITFFLFENNNDSLVIDDILNSFLAHPEILNDKTRFLTLMNLGISKTVAGRGSLERTCKIFDEACTIFPTMTSPNDFDIATKIVFCRSFQMLAFALYDNFNYAEFVSIYEKTRELLDSATPEILSEMWNSYADFDFHKNYLMRFFRLYGIFMANKNGFRIDEDSSIENQEALKTILSWTQEEFNAQKNEGLINPFIFTAFYKQQKNNNEITEDEYKDILVKKFNEFMKMNDQKCEMIYPSLAFPDDTGFIDPCFANMMDRMKLFNKSFSYVFTFLSELLQFSDDERILTEICRYFQLLSYADKGFSIDKFVIQLIETIAQKMDSVEKFINFVQTVFIHRQISSAIHIRMVSSISGICFSHFIQKRPELFTIEGKYETAEEVSKNINELTIFLKNGAILHDLGKLSFTDLINMHYREITDSEFALIKSHAAMGANIVENFPYLALYKDFMQGHHKYWDDSYGYPENFHIQDSKYKYYVALICIADCIDTTTDTTGRNYQKQKTFDDIFKELKEQAGTRYCPELVKMLEEDESLQEELRILTSQNGRNYNSYQIYHNFIESTIVFLEKDERTISKFNTRFEKHLLTFFKTCFKNTPEDRIIKHIKELKNDQNTRLFIMHNKENKIYGIFGGHITVPLNDDDIYLFITDAFVLPEYRRKGYGTELLTAATRFMRAENIFKIKTSVHKQLIEETFFWINGFYPAKEYIMENIFQ